MKVSGINRSFKDVQVVIFTINPNTNKHQHADTSCQRTNLLCEPADWRTGLRWKGRECVSVFECLLLFIRRCISRKKASIVVQGWYFTFILFLSFCLLIFFSTSLSGPEISWQTSLKLLQSEFLACDHHLLDSPEAKELQPDTMSSIRHLITGLLSVCTNSWMLCVFFRDSPVVQGNSILALSSLAAVLAKYESNLPADSDGSLGVTCSIIKLSLCYLLHSISVTNISMMSAFHETDGWQ